MNAQMQQQTKKLLVRLGIILVLFSAFSTAFAVSVRYRRMLSESIENQEKIVRNISRMNSSARDLSRTIAVFRGMLPQAFESSSPEWLLYSQMDGIKTLLAPKEMLVKGIDNKEGLISVDFAATMELPESIYYSSVINRLGRMQTLICPSVDINSIAVEQSASDGRGGLKMTIEGAAQMPASNQSVTAGAGS